MLDAFIDGMRQQMKMNAERDKVIEQVKSELLKIEMNVEMDKQEPSIEISELTDKDCAFVLSRSLPIGASGFSLQVDGKHDLLGFRTVMYFPREKHHEARFDIIKSMGNGIEKFHKASQKGAQMMESMLKDMMAEIG